ncbi:MAG: pilus assembly protein PilM, partial [Actinobacteria bacterium]|nr:pilus assembly protein PilM [Actinomycetota bacterium]
VPGTLRGADPDNPQALADGIRRTLDRAGITARTARIAVSDEAAVVRVVEVPRMSGRHLPGALRYLSEQQTPFPAGQASLAWDVVAQGPSSQRLYLAAAWKDVVNRLAASARSAGLEPTVVEPRSLAVGRAVGQRPALVVDAIEGRAQVLHLALNQAPFTDETALPADEEWEVLKGMLERALRNHRSHAPVLLAGGLEAMASSPEAAALLVQTLPASHALNGKGPARPPNLPSGFLLGPLGLAMRGTRTEDGGYPQVNLLSQGEQTRKTAAQRVLRRANRRLLTIGAAFGAVVVWSAAGAAVAMVMGWHPHLPLGP